MAKGGHTNDALICAVNAEQRIYLVVVKCAFFATSEIEANCCEGEVFGDMAGIEVNVPVGSLAILEFAALEDGGPYKDGGGFGAHRLAEGSFGDGGAKVALL